MQRSVLNGVENLSKKPPNAAAGGSGDARYCFGPFVLDPVEHRFEREGTPLSLTPRAFALLLALVENVGHLVTKETLLQRVWPGTAVEEANLSVQVSRLRRLLGDAGASPRYVETVPKFGYRFVAPVEVMPSRAPMPHQSGSATAHAVLQRAAAAGVNEHVRLTIQLTRIRDGQTLWTEAVEGVLQGPLDVQKRITEEIADILSRVKVAGTHSGTR